MEIRIKREKEFTKGLLSGKNGEEVSFIVRRGEESNKEIP